MKNILVPTDFSENAAHASRTALMLARKLRANLLLLNNIASIPVTPYNIGGGFVAEEASWQVNESKDKLHQLTKELESRLDSGNADQFKPIIHSQISEGDLGMNIAALVGEGNIEMIVLGEETGGIIEHLITGSDSQSVIDHALCPVLIMPQYSELEDLKKIVFGTDYKIADAEAINFLVKLGKAFDFRLEIVHVSLTNGEETFDEEAEMDFVNRIAAIQWPNMIFKDVRGSDVITRLNLLCEEGRADLLALVRYPHSCISRIAKTHPTDKALHSQSLPLLLCPGNLQEKKINISTI